MKLFAQFVGDLDAAGEKISTKLSEIDLSNPEDVKALVPSGASDILVHFGESDFLHRYEIMRNICRSGKGANPRLASVDMRYEHQVVLEMSKPTVVEVSAKPLGERAPGKPVATSAAAAATKTTAVHSAAKPVPVKPAAKAPPAQGRHLETAFDVHAKSGTAATHGTQAVPQ